jgi:uncharacterized protein (TIGR02246 family)
MTTDPTTVASEFYATLEKAWNDADGAAFAAPFSDDASFVDIRGETHDGGRAELGAGHQAIFDSIYRGSVVRIALDGARAVGDNVVLARGRSTLDVPAGPLAGVINAVNSTVLVRADDEWRAASFHNTRVTG